MFDGGFKYLKQILLVVKYIYLSNGFITKEGKTFCEELIMQLKVFKIDLI